MCPVLHVHDSLGTVGYLFPLLPLHAFKISGGSPNPPELILRGLGEEEK